jgi:hypothetical protein
LETKEIPSIKPPEGNFGQPRQYGNQQLDRAGKPVSSKTNSDIVTPSSLNHLHFNKLENIKAQFHGVAQEIRNVQETLTSVSSHLVKMREALESVLKIYPPYPPGSSERIEALRQFAALRNLIDHLAASPNAERAEFVNLDSDISTDRLGIEHYQVQAGKQGLDIPHLDANSSDQQICDALEKVTAAQNTMGSRQQEFISYANGLIAKIR